MPQSKNIKFVTHQQFWFFIIGYSLNLLPEKKIPACTSPKRLLYHTTYYFTMQFSTTMKKQIKRGAPPLRFKWACLPVLLLLMAFLWSNCTKDPTPDTPLTEEDKLPPATQEGKNTFGCLVNGKAWKPKGGGLLKPGLQLSYSEISGNFFISAIHYRTEGFSGLGVSNGLFPLFDASSVVLSDSAVFYYDTHLPCETPYYYTSIGVDKEGYINVSKIDREKGFISGTFEFDILDPVCLDTFKITKGRFDIKYK
jgi:hypothetical protein